MQWQVGSRSVRRLGAVAVAVAVLLFAGVDAAGAPAAPCEAESDTRVLVRVHGVRNADGYVTAVLYGDNPAHFLAKGKRLARVRIPARPGTVAACVATPGPGVYALAVFHDEDGDKKLGQNVIGLPTEAYGFSNDAPVFLGPPAFEDVAFRAGSGETALDVRLRY